MSGKSPMSPTGRVPKKLSPGESKYQLTIPSTWEKKVADIYGPQMKGKIKPEKGKLQGIWQSNSSSIISGPEEVWLFPKGQVPKELQGPDSHKSAHKHGHWGYAPGVKGGSPQVADDLWCYPPDTTPPNNFQSKGIWTYALQKRDDSHIPVDASGFIPMGRFEKKQDKLDVAGNWNLLYQRPGEFQIKIRKGGDKIICTLDVIATDTIANIKGVIQMKTKIPKEQQKLSFNGVKLDNKTQSIGDYGIQHGNILDLSDGMKIYVINKFDDTKVAKMTFDDVTPTTSISDIQKKIDHKSNIPKKDQRLTFNGEKLLGITLKDCNINDGDTLVLEPMNIYVVRPNSPEKIKLTVKPSDKIKSDIKSKIKDKTNIPVPEQRLSFNGKPLTNDSSTLRDNGIEHGDTIHLDPMHVFVVKRDTGDKIKLIVEPTDRIKNDLKPKIESKTKIPVSDQRLTFNNSPLKDGSLRDNGVQHGDTLMLEPMEIFVRKPNGEKMKLQVSPDDRIKNDIKKKVKDKSGIPIDEQRLEFGGTPLPDGSTLRDNGIKHGDILDLSPMHIFVKKPDGTKIKLSVEPTDRIKNDIKRKVQDKEGIPIDEQRLSFGGNMLPDGSTLRDNNIKHGDTLNLEPMIVYILQPNGDKFPLTVEPTNKIKADIKKKVHDKNGMPIDEQRLTFGGQLLPDNSTLRENGVKHKDTLILQPMEVFVRKPDGEKLKFVVEPTDKISDIKKRVKDKTGIPPAEQEISFNGQPLKDNTNLRDNGIKHGDTLDLGDADMHIFVKKPNGQVFRLDNLKPSDKIGYDIKPKIKQKENIPLEQQRLKFKGNPLQDPSSLKDNGIKSGDTIELEPMVINVRKPNGSTFKLTVDPEDPIFTVKDKIQQKENIPKDQQRLQFKNTPMQDQPTLKDYNVKHGDTLDLLPMKIFVQKPVGTKITLEPVIPENTIDQIKDMVTKLEGIPKKRQILSFQGRDLDNDQATLAQCKIKHLDTLHLGMIPEKSFESPKPEKKKYEVEVTGWMSPMDYVGGKSKVDKDGKYVLADSRIEPSYLEYKREKSLSPKKSPTKKKQEKA